MSLRESSPLAASGALVRRAEGPIRADLPTKMVFVAGPRQCGKTTLARRLLADIGGSYLSWDVAAHRKAARDMALPEPDPLWVFDELHKLRTWRTWLKGVYDLHGARHQILVTGSARLDAYRRGGDSLQGRYLLHRLHPFTLAELCGGLTVSDDIDAIPRLPLDPPSGSTEALDALSRLGGFPEPLMNGSERFAARWRLGYGSRLVREDIRDAEDFRDLDRLELLFDRLPDVVGSLLSLNSLREDLEVAFATVESWVSALERMYAVFRISPFGPPRIRAVKKTQKLYLWDWARATDPAARGENLVLFHLLRLVHWLADVHGEKAELRFFRDSAGHEVDAIITRNRKPWMAVEVKLDDRPLDRGLRYLLERTHIPFAFQVSLAGSLDRVVEGPSDTIIRQVPAARFLANLP